MATIAWVSSALPRAVVRISAPGGYCTGAIVAPEWVLTCAHFLRGRSVEQVRVLIDGSLQPITHMRAFPGTDIALLQLHRPVVAPSLRIGPPPKPGARTVTFGYGQRAAAAAARPGRYLGTLPAAISRGMETVVRPAGMVYTNPPAVKGDSGGPVMVNGRVVGVQSLILDPLGRNLRIATVSLLRPDVLGAL